MKKIFQRLPLGRGMDVLSYGYAFWINQYTSGFHRLEEPGGLRGSFEVGVGAAEEGKIVYLVFQVENDSKNAVWPRPTNGKEGRGGADKTYYDLRDMYGGHVWRRISLPINKAWSAYVDHLRSWWKIYFEALVDIAEGIENTAKTCVRLIILKRIDKKYLADTNLHVHLEEIKVDKTFRFVEEPIGNIDHEVKSLKRSRIPIFKSIGTRSEVIRIS
ncbi:hypothetical protein Tco_0485611 [Tanacetum coccineum]